MVARILLVWKRTARKVKNNLETIWMILFGLNPLIGLFVSGKQLIMLQIFVNLVIVALVFADRYIHNKYDDIPVMRRPFVRYEKSSNKVLMKPEDMYEVLNYLVDLQEYFEKRGML